jgi:hypothetical protein
MTAKHIVRFHFESVSYHYTNLWFSNQLNIFSNKSNILNAATKTYLRDY